MWWSIDRITPLDDHSAASWIQEGLLPFQREQGYRVGNVVPRGFESYARVFHPASRYFADRRVHEPVRWSQVASWTGRTAHAAMQFHSILGHPQNPYPKLEWIDLPGEGWLLLREASSVSEVLARFTTTPETCFFCIWEGWGWPGGTSFAYLGSTGNAADPHNVTGHEARREHDASGRIKITEPLEIGLFEYRLFTGALNVIEHTSEESPSIWWPQDRAWCVSTDIDMTSTLVGGTAECIAALVGHPGLEAMPIAIDVRIDVEGDTVNT